MIGSLMSRMGMADKLSIPQLQQAIQDGTLPAYVGVPLLQQKIQQAKQAQSLMAQPQPTIAQQVMGEAQGIEQAQSNLPAEGFADGGILNFQPVNTDDSEHEYAGGGMVAFANRGLVDDDDEDEDLEELRDEELLKQELGKLLSNKGSDINLTQSEKQFGIRPELPSGQGIREDAKAPSGIDALSFKEKIQHLESRGRHTDEKGNILTSPKGAEGIMQVMPNTQRDPGFGVKPAKDRSAAELERVGRDYADAMLRRYGDEKLAAMAYNWGPGNVDKWIEGGMKGPIPAETRQYAANFASGGIAQLPTRHYVEGDVVAPADSLAPGEDIVNVSDVPKGIAQYDVNQYLRDIANQRAELQKNREQDKYMALLQAGLGMMAGTSPYAAANIGKGAMSGIQELSEANKQRIAEEAALSKAAGVGLRLKSYEDVKKEAMKDKEALKLQELERKEQERADRVNANIERMPRVKAVMDKMKYLDPNSEEYKAYAQHLEDIYDSAYKQAGIKRPRISLPELKLPTPKQEPGFWDKIFGNPSTPAAPAGTIKFNAKGEQIQ